MAKDITAIEGIGDAYATQLKVAGIESVDALLATGATPEGRKGIAAKSGIGSAFILKWVNHADLFRIKGIGGQYSELLEAAGVDTVVELAQRNPENLHAKMTEVNDEKKLVRLLPALKSVGKWIKAAGELPRGVHY